MRALILEVDEHLLAERHRLGLDKGDEMWEGVLHMVPAPFTRHGEVQAALAAAFLPTAQRRGLSIATQVAVIRAEDDYRIPDLAVFRPEAGDRAGITHGAELIVEVRSPGDESFEKLPWYLAQGCREVLIVDRDTLSVELFTASGEVEPDADGFFTLESIGVRIGPGNGGAVLVVDSPSGAIELRFDVR